MNQDLCIPWKPTDETGMPFISIPGTSVGVKLSAYISVHWLYFCQHTCVFVTKQCQPGWEGSDAHARWVELTCDTSWHPRWPWVQLLKERHFIIKLVFLSFHFVTIIFRSIFKKKKFQSILWKNSINIFIFIFSDNVKVYWETFIHFILLTRHSLGCFG